MSEDPRAWAGVDAALAPLGRAALLVDEDLRVVKATASLNLMVCDGAADRILGRPIIDLLGEELFRPDGPVIEALRTGQRQEGRRAFIQCGDAGARLVSVSIAPLGARGELLGPRGHFLVVLRPAEDVARELDGAMSDVGIVTRSPAMFEVIHVIEALHRSEATVLITGESGVGKEVVARAIHSRSPRRKGPFVAVNCAALPGGLLESELFGHVRGAFTGAERDRAGRMELAAGGTLFLDEIGDLPAPLQVKLLRVLQERVYERVGESESRPFTARVIAATNVDVEEAVDSGQLRKDLYYRLRVVPIHVPPLRDRSEDIEPLARVLLARLGERTGRELLLSPEALRRLQGYDWPGNVRELENKLEFASAMCRGQTLTVEHFPELSGAASEPPDAPDEGDEAARIRRALEQHHWRRADAARALGMSRTTLWRRMQALGIE